MSRERKSAKIAAACATYSSKAQEKENVQGEEERREHDNSSNTQRNDRVENALDAWIPPVSTPPRPPPPPSLAPQPPALRALTRCCHRLASTGRGGGPPLLRRPRPRCNSTNSTNDGNTRTRTTRQDAA